MQSLYHLVLNLGTLMIQTCINFCFIDQAATAGQLASYMNAGNKVVNFMLFDDL